MTGRRPLPREEHVRRGTLKPSRHGTASEALPVNRERPGEPPGLTAPAKRIWLAILDDLEQLGILARSDWPMIEIAAVCLGRARELRAPIQTARRQRDYDLLAKLIKLEGECLNRGRQAAEQLGLSPSARQRVGMQVARAQGGAARSPGAAASSGADESNVFPISPRRGAAPK